MGLYEEFAYLSTKNKFRYSAIMNIFLYESERINMEMTEEYIYKIMIDKGYVKKEEYSRQQLLNDLLYLEENNNISVQEENLQNIHTLEEYKNRKKYYSITRKGAFVARNIRQYHLMADRTCLCDEHFERLIKDIKECKRKNSYESWNMFYDDCRTVFQIYQDFLAEFNNKKFEKIITTKEFLSYKKEFLEQINLLIDKLSRYAGIIGKEIENISREDQKFLHVKKWFLYIDGEEPTYMSILHYSSVLIEKITRKARMLVTSGEENADYKTALARFMKCEDLEECEELSLELFGYQTMDHLNYSEPFNVKETEFKIHTEKNQEPYDAEQKFNDEKMALEYLRKEIKKEEQILMSTDKNTLSFEKMSNMDTDKTLTVLSWLGKALEDKNKRSETESGRRFHIEGSEHEGCVQFQTEYGKLTMPDFRFVFEDVKHE